MDRIGPMFHYLLPLSSPFLVQSWNTMQWNSKKMGKKYFIYQQNAQGYTLFSIMPFYLDTVFS